MSLKVELNKNFKPSINNFKKNIDLEIEKIGLFHSKIGNQETPLIELPELAKNLGIKKLLIKDESYRFGLHAFKALGASYAMSKQINENPEIEIFCTATDGNHGKAVAWMATKLNKRAIIYMPKGTVAARIDSIKKEGADVIVIDKAYDIAVEMAKKRVSFENQQSGLKKWCLIQDTAWEGYEEIPLDIMKGYWTQIHEVTKQILDKKIDLVILQSGVGSWAASIVDYIITKWEKAPFFISVEPHSANCLFESIKRGKRISIQNNKSTNMAGLDCGSVSTLAWNILSENLAGSISISDSLCEKSMIALANPLIGDPMIVSGESGASGLAALMGLSKNDDFKEFKQNINLNKTSTVLIFNTEGATDPVNYKKVTNT